MIRSFQNDSIDEAQNSPKIIEFLFINFICVCHYYLLQLELNVLLLILHSLMQEKILKYLLILRFSFFVKLSLRMLYKVYKHYHSNPKEHAILGGGRGRYRVRIRIVKESYKISKNSEKLAQNLIISPLKPPFLRNVEGHLPQSLSTLLRTDIIVYRNKYNKNTNFNYIDSLKTSLDDMLPNLCILTSCIQDMILTSKQMYRPHQRISSNHFESHLVQDHYHFRTLRGRSSYEML